MRFKVILSREGRTTIDEQMDWYCSDATHGGEELAAGWLDKLHPTLASLSEMPGKHGLAPENGRWHPELQVRQMLFRPWKAGGGWRVLFAIDEPLRRVTILQIRHEHRRWLFEAKREQP